MEKKRLLIHMDDMGMEYAANEAGKRIFAQGIGSSASIIMQAAWAKEFADWWKLNPQYDVGIHLAQTSEWDVARWRPLCGEEECPSLYDADGYCHKGMDENSQYTGVFEEYKKEVDKQLELAKRWGIHPTHIDSHMIVDWREDDRFVYYIQKAVDEKVRINIGERMLWNDFRKEFVKKMAAENDNIVTNAGVLNFGMTKDYERGVAEFIKAIETMKPGFCTYTVHPIIETDSIKMIIPEWQQRVNEANLLLDKRACAAVERNGIELVGWAEV